MEYHCYLRQFTGYFTRCDGRAVYCESMITGAGFRHQSSGVGSNPTHIKVAFMHIKVTFMLTILTFCYLFRPISSDLVAMGCLTEWLR
jgi:hypothetical protein